MEKLTALGVTDQQREQIKGILQQHRDEVKPMVNSFVSERRALRDLIRADTVDETAIRAQVAKVAKVGADLAVERAKIGHEIRGVLTPEQIQKLKDQQVDLDRRIDHLLGGGGAGAGGKD